MQRNGLTGWRTCEECPGCNPDADIVDDAGSDVDYPDESDQTEVDLEFENRLEEFFEQLQIDTTKKVDALIEEGRVLLQKRIDQMTGCATNTQINLIENPTKASWKSKIKSKK